MFATAKSISPGLQLFGREVPMRFVERFRIILCLHVSEPMFCWAFVGEKGGTWQFENCAARQHNVAI